VRADTSKLARKLSPKRSKDGITYYAIDVKIILLFGLTELKAQVSWMEDVSQLLLSASSLYATHVLLYEQGTEVR